MRNSRIRKGFSLLLVPFFFLTSGAVSRAQSLQWVGNVAEGVLSVHGTADGHVLLNKGHVVELLDMASEKIRYSHTSYAQGEISWIDSKNSFKLLLFSAPYQQFYYLDNRLTPLSQPAAVSHWTAGEVQAVCASYNDGIWIYEPIGSCLKRIGKEGQWQATELLSRYTGGAPFHPVQLLESSRHLVALDTNYGLLFFDIHGNFIRPYPMRDCRYVAESGDIYWVLAKESLVALSLSRGEPLFTIPLPPQPSVKALLPLGRELLLLTEEGRLLRYQIHD